MYGCTKTNDYKSGVDEKMTKPDAMLTIQLLHKQLEPVIFHDLECLELKNTKDNKYHYDLLEGNLKDLFNGIVRQPLPDFEKAYNILMDWFDHIPEEDRQEVSDQLEKVGC